MKKILAVCTAFIVWFGSLAVYWQSFGTVLDWMFSNWLTKYDQAEDFRPADYITRWEAAKFVDSYAKVEGLTKNYNQCAFSDIEGYDYTLIPHIKEACEYWLLKGSNGRYNPNGNITEAQAITVVVRTLKWFLDETGDKRRQPYYEVGKELGIIQWETLDGVNQVNISRQKLGTWFYQASQMVTDQDLIKLDGEEDLRGLMYEIFGDVKLP